MKRPETLSNMLVNGKNGHQEEESRENLLADYELIGEDHSSTKLDTPMREDAFVLSDEEKIHLLEEKFADILHILGMDLSDDSLKGTPYRVAKMYVKEIFQGLNPANRPSTKLFENKYRYGQMLVERDITLHSYCEHHLVPIIGKAHVAYISRGQVVGLSKINRIVRYYAKRPQVQERLTEQIAADLKKSLNTPDVAVLIEAVHLCVTTRGVEDTSSSTVTSHFSGRFNDEQSRNEFLQHINHK
jgi:GTP cyclohydrolase I